MLYKFEKGLEELKKNTSDNRQCHKFRTMSEKRNGSTVSVAEDSCIAPLGAKLRHWKLDELPGLWDVLVGNMSFVGPRPDVSGCSDKLEGAVLYNDNVIYPDKVRLNCYYYGTIHL